MSDFNVFTTIGEDTVAEDDYDRGCGNYIGVLEEQLEVSKATNECNPVYDSNLN